MFGLVQEPDAGRRRQKGRRRLEEDGETGERRGGRMEGGRGRR